MTATSRAEPRATRRRASSVIVAGLSGARRGAASLALAGAVLAAPLSALAQDASLVPGDGVVTRFSGFADAETRTPDPDGIVAEVMVLETGGAVPAAPEVLASLTAAQVGQVFATEIAGADAPAVYLAATSAFGLYRSEDGAEWAPGMWGPEGGPGTIWRLSPGGDPEIFATIGEGEQENKGAGLGDLAQDEANGRLIVSDLSSGMIHSLDIETGEVVQTFDHGVDGRSYFLDAPTREYMVFDVMPFDPRNRPRFEGCRGPSGEGRAFAAEPGCWGFTDFRRRVWGLGVAQDPGGETSRLYYAVWGGAALGSDGWRGGEDDARTSIWSVRLDERGAFDLTDVRREAVLPPRDPALSGSSPVVDIAFPDERTMVLAERGMATGLGEDAAVLAEADTARVLVLKRGDDGVWTPEGRYAAGAGSGLGAAGGVALGARAPAPSDDGPEARIWLTVDPLCTADGPCDGIDAGQGPVAGLLATPLRAAAGLDAAVADDPQSQRVAVATERALPGGALGQVAIYRGPEVDFDLSQVPVAERRPAERQPQPQADETPRVVEIAPEPEREPQPDLQIVPLPQPAEPEEDLVQELPLSPSRVNTDLAVSMAALENCKPGTECVFEIAIANRGAEGFAGPLVVTETPGSAGVSYIGGGGNGWECLAEGGAVFCRHDDLSLAAGADTSFPITLQPSQGYGDGRLDACAAITWLGLQGRDRIRAVQARLREAGIEVGSVDGIMGPNTEAAIDRGKDARGLETGGGITGDFVEAYFGNGAFVEGDATGDNDRACATATVELPPRPAHDPEISAFHRDHESRYHDPATSTPEEIHEPQMSRFHETFRSNVHDPETSAPREERPGQSFHDGTYSRFRSDGPADAPPPRQAPPRQAPPPAPEAGQAPGQIRVHDRQTSETLSLHEVRMSNFHRQFNSRAHDRRTSQPAVVHDPRTTRPR